MVQGVPRSVCWVIALFGLLLARAPACQGEPRILHADPALSWTWSGTTQLTVQVRSSGLITNRTEAGLWFSHPQAGGRVDDGAPEVPVFVLMFEAYTGTPKLESHTAIPDAGRVLPGYLLPVEVETIRSVDDLKTVREKRRDPDPAIYQSSTPWPEQPVQINEAIMMRRRILRLAFLPVRYNPKEQVVQFFDDFSVTLRFDP